MQVKNSLHTNRYNKRGESHVICVDQPRRRGIANCSQVEVVGCSQEEEMFMFTG
jgi:hypothetical protein